MSEPFLTELFERAIDEKGVLGDVLVDPGKTQNFCQEGENKGLPGPCPEGKQDTGAPPESAGEAAPAAAASSASAFVSSMESALDDLDAENADSLSSAVDDRFESAEAAITARADDYYEHFSATLREDMGEHVEDAAPQAAQDFRAMTGALASDLNYALNQARESFLAYANAVSDGQDEDVTDGLAGEFHSNLEACREATANFPRLMQERYDEAYDAARQESGLDFSETAS